MTNNGQNFTTMLIFFPSGTGSLSISSERWILITIYLFAAPLLAPAAHCSSNPGAAVSSQRQQLLNAILQIITEDLCWLLIYVLFTEDRQVTSTQYWQDLITSLILYYYQAAITDIFIKRPYAYFELKCLITFSLPTNLPCIGLLLAVPNWHYCFWKFNRNLKKNINSVPHSQI